MKATVWPAHDDEIVIHCSECDRPGAPPRPGIFVGGGVGLNELVAIWNAHLAEVHP